jgi:preprotein translocase subunit SecG
MQTVIIAIHLMVVLALVAVVLLQRSEGGGLGIGGGQGGFMTGRGQANLLTRATAILAAAFFVTSMSLSLLARFQGSGGSVFDRVSAPVQNGQPAPAGGGQTPFEQLGGQKPASPGPASPGPAAPAPAAPATPAPAAPSGPQVPQSK